MSELEIYVDSNGAMLLRHFTHRSMVQESLGTMGIKFEKWAVHEGLADGADKQAVLDFYGGDIQKVGKLITPVQILPISLTRSVTCCRSGFSNN